MTAQAPTIATDGQRVTSRLVDIGPYTTIPNRFFGSGIAARLGPTASLFYVVLCDFANRNGSNTFKVSDKVLAADTGIAPRTICDARKRLMEHQLISCVRPNGQSYTYTIPKPSLNWSSFKERPRPKQRPRAIHASRSAIQ